MTDYIITYDLTRTNHEPHSTMLEAEERGWSRWIWGPQSKKWFRRPNTTLVGVFADRDTAKRAFDDAVAATSQEIGRKVTVEKFILASYSGELFNSGDRVDPT
ncbi:hypothetical protein [Pseudaminobacter sp. NGMCC 1.201702]|uniref:hypothetical protein n=1 Tax=Pseudaminobacter sp. NGMCC 1.201702 TaxID=3391825 RepID=UPI0039EE61B8